MAKQFSIEAVFRAVDRLTAPVKKMQSRVSRFADSASKGLAKIDGFNKRIHGTLKSAASSVLSVGKVIAAGVATGAAALGGLVVATNKVADRMDDLAKRSRRLQFPIEALQEWTFAAEQSGITNEEFSNSLDIFARSIGQAKSGFGPLSSMLKRTNPQLLSQLETATDSAAAFDLYVDAMRSVTNPAERAALAAAAFGRGGTKMAQIADSSSDAIENLRNEMRQNGVVTMAQAELAEKYNDQMNSLKRSFGAFMQSVLVPIMPHLTELAGNLREWIVANRELLSQRVHAFLEQIRTELPPIITAVTQFVSKVWENRDAIMSWGKRLAILVGGFYAFAAATKLAQGAIVLFKVGLAAWNVAAAITKGLVFAIEGAMWLMGGSMQWVSLKTLLMNGAMAVLKAGMIALNAVMALNPFVLIGIAIVAAGLLIWKFWDEISGFFGMLWGGVKSVGTAIGEFFAGVWDGVKDTFISVITFIAQKLIDFISGPARLAIMAAEKVGLVSAGTSQRVTEALTINSPQERTARSVSESATSVNGEIRVSADRGASATVTQAPRKGSGISLRATGAM